MQLVSRFVFLAIVTKAYQKYLLEDFFQTELSLCDFFCFFILAFILFTYFLVCNVFEDINNIFRWKWEIYILHVIINFNQSFIYTSKKKKKKIFENWSMFKIIGW